MHLSLRPAPALLALLLSMLPAFGGTPTTERGPQRARPGAAAEDNSQGRVIVQYRSASALMRAWSPTGGARVRPQHAATLGQRLGLPMQDGRVLGERMQALRGQGVNSAALAAKLRLQDDVEWAVVDERRYISSVPNDTLYAANTSTSPAVGQWYLRAPDAAVTSAAKPVVSAINAEAAWAITPGSASITVAVLDTGVRFDHPDFVKADGTSKLWPGYDFVGDTVSAGDGSGRDADASDPGDYSTTNQCGSGTAASSSSWHGTQTAGLVGAATDNNLGMASVGRNTMVLPVRVLGKCGGSDSDIIAAMYWAAGIAIPGDASTPANPHPAQVISMSLGKAGSCPASYNNVFAALAAAKVTVVIAAGNTNGLAVEAPANCSGALAVAGVRHIGSKVGYSSIGPQVSIAAPAGNCVNTSGACLYPILTTTNKGTTTPSTNSFSDSTDISVGTSFAAPVVAGAVALMLAVDPTLTPATIAAKIKSTARTFPTTGATDATVAACKAPSATEQLECYCTTSTCGAGMLDAGAAVAAVVPPVAAPTTAIAVSNRSPTAGASVTLSASNATANGGRSIASYQWQITSGSAFAAFSGATNAASATLATSAAGSVVVSLTVTDSGGASGSASSTLSVQAAPVAPPSTAISVSDGSPTAGATITLSASGASANGGRSIAGYQWQITSGSSFAAFSGATNTPSATLVTSAAGSVVVSLIVTDSAGASGNASSTVSVQAPVAPPSTAISVSNSSPTAGTSVTVSASGATANGGRSIASYQWQITSGGSFAAFSGATNAASATLATSAAGSVVVSLTVTDSAGASGSASSTVSVQAAPVTPSTSASTTTSSSSGGGAMSALWVAWLGVAACALRRANRRAACRP